MALETPYLSCTPARPLVNILRAVTWIEKRDKRRATVDSACSRSLRFAFSGARAAPAPGPPAPGSRYPLLLVFSSASHCWIDTGHTTIRFLALLIALATATMDSAANGSNGSAASPAPGVWSAEELMGAGNGSSMLATSAVTTSSQQGSVRKMSKKGVADPMDWGSPGHLTKEEVDVFVSLVLS